MSRNRHNRYKPMIPDTPPKVAPKLVWEYNERGRWYATYSEFTYIIITRQIYKNRTYVPLKELFIQTGNVQRHVTGGQTGSKLRKLAEKDLNRQLNKLILNL